MRALMAAYLLGSVSILAWGQTIDDSWIDGVASPEDVRDYYTGGRELEDAARQSVALATIYRYSGLAIREKAGRDWTPREEAFRERFDALEVAIDDRIREQYGRMSSEMEEFQQLKSALRDDPRNRLDILERFAPPIAAIMGPDLAAEAERYEVFQQNGVVGGLILLTAVVALAYLLVTSVADRRTSYGMDVEESQDKTVVQFKPGRHGVSTLISVYGSYIAVGLFVGVLAAIAAVMFAVSRDYAWMEQPIPDWLLPVLTEDFWWIALLVLLAIPVWMLAMSNFTRRKRQAVVITKDGIRGRGQRLDKKRIGEMYVWGVGEGGESPEEDAPVLMVGNAASRAAAAGRLHGAHMRGSFRRVRRQLGRVGHQVCADYGERREIIANRLPFKRACLVRDAIEAAASRLHGRVVIDGMVTTVGD